MGVILHADYPTVRKRSTIWSGLNRISTAIADCNSGYPASGICAIPTQSQGNHCAIRYPWAPIPKFLQPTKSPRPIPRWPASGPVGGSRLRGMQRADETARRSRKILERPPPIGVTRDAWPPLLPRLLGTRVDPRRRTTDRPPRDRPDRVLSLRHRPPTTLAPCD